MELLYLSRGDVEQVNLPMTTIIGALEDMFREKGKGQVEMPPKPGIHPEPDAFIHAMPALIPELGAAGMKWVSGFPENKKHDLPYISGLIVLNDPKTGVPISVMDCTWITAMRTGAATAVAAKYLARPDSRSAGIIACGVQGRTNLEALACQFQLERVHVYDIDVEAARKFGFEVAEHYPVHVHVVNSAREAVDGLDLVVTSGPILKDPKPTIEAGWLGPGAFASAVDFDSYFQGAAMREADRLVTDDRRQMEYYRAEGYFQDTPQPDSDLGDIVCGRKPGRKNPDERAIAINLGLGLADMAVAIRVYRAAMERGIGTLLPL